MHMRSPLCLTMYPSVSVHLSVYPTKIFKAYMAYEIALLSVYPCP
jgi:hypothetical protein